MDKISNESPTWPDWVSESRKSGFRTVARARKSIKTRATATARQSKPSCPSFRPTFAWRRPSRRPRETRLTTDKPSVSCSPFPHRLRNNRLELETLETLMWQSSWPLKLCIISFLRWWTWWWFLFELFSNKMKENSLFWMKVFWKFKKGSLRINRDKVEFYFPACSMRRHQ